MASLEDMADGRHEYQVKVGTLANVVQVSVYSSLTKETLFEMTWENAKKQEGFLTNHRGNICFIPLSQIVFLEINYIRSS